MNPLKRAGRVLKRWRSAITGRWVSADYAKAHPDTTVSQSVRDRIPGRRCRAPGAECVNQRRCDRFGRCCWETDEALRYP